MKKIDVSTEKYPNTFMLLDDDDYEWAKYYKWSVSKHSSGVIYVSRNHKGRTVRIHRDVLRARSHEQVDHINGDGLDNRKENLRFCTVVQNARNMKKHIGKSGSRYKGVFQRKSSKGVPGRFFAHISVNNKTRSIGTFDTELEAAEQYDSKAKYYYGEFARLNFPDKDIPPTPLLNVETRNYVKRQIVL